MSKKKIRSKEDEVKDEINEFLEIWNSSSMYFFLKDIIPLFKLYDVDEKDDWLFDEVGEDSVHTVRLITTVMMISEIADKHAGKLCLLASKFPNLWLKIKKSVKDVDTAAI